MDISLAESFSELPLPLPFASIRIEHSGSAGSLTAEASSVELGGDLVVDSHVVNEADGMNIDSGINPWHLDDKTESILFLTNTGPDSAQTTFRIEAEGISYFADVRLQPYEIKVINVRALRDSQTKDLRGNLIPLRATTGNVRWKRIRGSKLAGRMLVISAERGISSNFSCGDPPCGDSYQNTFVTFPNGECDTLTPGHQCQFAAEDEYLDQNYNSYYVVANPWWSSSDTSVASIDINSGLMTAIRAGNVTITGDDGGGPVYYPNGDWQSGCTQQGNDYPGTWPLPVYDPTPNITSVSPNPLNGGFSGTLYIYGSGFGSNPLVIISDPNNAISINSTSPINDGQINVGITISANDPGDTITITVTSRGYNGQSFTSSQGNSAMTSFSLVVNPIAAPVPQIFFAGNTSNNIAGTTQPVVVGQPLALAAADNAPIAVSSESWSSSYWSSNTVVSNYTFGSNNSSATVSFYVPTTSHSSSGTFYWISNSGGNPWAVTYTYCMVNSQCNSAYVSFNVASPTVSLTPVVGNVDDYLINSNNQIDSNGSPKMILIGVPAHNNTQAGIKLPAITTPPGDSGYITWAQLISGDSLKIRKSDGPHSCTGGPSGSPQLDTEYPYSVVYTTNVTNDTATDNPAAPLTQSQSELQRLFSASMYLLWNPVLPSGCANADGSPGPSCTSIPVSLGYVNWGFTGDTINSLSTAVGSGLNGTTWWLGCQSEPTTVSFHASSVYPTWTQVYSGSQSCP